MDVESQGTSRQIADEIMRLEGHTAKEVQINRINGAEVEAEAEDGNSAATGTDDTTPKMKI